MSKHEEPKARDIANRTEVYREPVRIEPETQKDQPYREPKPQGGNQGGEKK